MFTVWCNSATTHACGCDAAVQVKQKHCKKCQSFTEPLLAFHFHVLRFTELLLAGFLLLLLRVVMVVVHVGSCYCGCDAVLPACFAAVDLVQGRFGGEPGSGLLVRCGRMRRWGGQVEPLRPGLLCCDLGLVRCQRRGMRRGGRRGSGQRNADVFARYSPNLGAFGGCESLADGGWDGWAEAPRREAGVN